jgi:amino acid permease
MENPDKAKPKVAGGIFIAIGMVAGAGIGIMKGEPSAGMVIGFIAGLVVAALVWLIDSKRH